ncbi:hypothetical protein F0185_02575 [Massilia sp. CCM 8692]|uniref:Uncharacterized protein n=2 Tax=Massilia rubra TaxID=2607910 RepID=A0ABX0LJ55_9BURK|nr:hypothetical protein [Massilia rubra]
MWLVAIAWIYVVGLMALTEHSIVAGIMTFLGYCVLPLSIVWYIAGSKMRRMKIAQKEEMARRLRAGRQPDGPAASGERERERLRNARDADSSDSPDWSDSGSSDSGSSDSGGGDSGGGSSGD